MKIAAAQIACVLNDVSANLGKMCDFAERAKNSGAEWIVFPEMSDIGYDTATIRESAAPWTEGAVPQLQALAKRLAMGIVGGVSEREGKRIFNTQVVIDRGGDIVAKYRKTHLFAPAPIEEHKCFSAGSELAAIEFGKLRAGLSICYDLRFPELYRALALERGCNVFIVSSAWPTVRREHLRTLALARAIENQSYLVLANRVGTDRGGTFCGESLIIDPAGKVLASAPESEEALVQAEINSSVIETVRCRMAVFSDRRPEVYSAKME